MFSPYYARARRRGNGDPLEHCALNVCLYGETGKRWCLTERGSTWVRQGRQDLTIGPSSLTWDGETLTLRVDEVTAPMPSRIRGVVRLRPDAVSQHVEELDAQGMHRWWPIAPSCRIEVALDQPSLRWTGEGYLDSNSGDAPLEHTFTGWNWSRARLAGGDTVVLYDVADRGGGERALAMRFDVLGRVEYLPAPPPVPLPRTHWRIARATRADDGYSACVLRTLEDTPFYARSLLSARLCGEPVTAMHESLSLDRFRAGWVRLLLPFRMPRVAR